MREVVLAEMRQGRRKGKTRATVGRSKLIVCRKGEKDDIGAWGVERREFRENIRDLLPMATNTAE